MDFRAHMMKIDVQNRLPALGEHASSTSRPTKIKSEPLLAPSPSISPQAMTIQPSLPSKRSPSRSHNGCEISHIPPLTPAALLEGKSTFASNMSEINTRDATMDESNFSVEEGSLHEGFGYHDFHHPEDMSVSQLDLLLGEGNDFWDSGSAVSSKKRSILASLAARSNDSLEQSSSADDETGNERTRKRQRTNNDIDSDSQLRGPAVAETRNHPSLPSLNINTKTSKLISESIPSPSTSLSKSEQSRTESTISPTENPEHQTIPTIHTPSPPHSPNTDSPKLMPVKRAHSTLSISSYRCNGDTLEIYEKAHEVLTSRFSKVKSAPRMELPLRTLYVDSLGRALRRSTLDAEPERRVAIRINGYVRTKELLDVGPSPGSGKTRSEEMLKVKVEDKEGTEECMRKDTTWLAYVEEIRRRTSAPKVGDESVIFRVLGVEDETGSTEQQEHVFVILKGSDREGDNVVPVECDGIWIPTPEARNLKSDLAIEDEVLDEILDSGADSSGVTLEFPVGATTLTSPKLPPLPTTPTRPSARSLPSPASTPVPTPDGHGMPSANIGPALVDDDVDMEEGQDFLVFEGEQDWSKEDDVTSGIASDAPEAASAESPTGENLPVSIDAEQLVLVPATNPPPNCPFPMYMAEVDGIMVYITWLTKAGEGTTSATPAKEIANPLETTPATASDSTKPPASESASVTSTSKISSGGIPLLRRVDNNMVNATLLLHAGGLVTDKERSIVLSLERTRARCRKKGSSLYGTWIPLWRARQMARSFCLEKKTGVFLSDSLGRSAFGLDSSALTGKGKGRNLSELANAIEVPFTLPASADVPGSTPSGSIANLTPAAAALAANKAAMLGLTSLPPNVASGLASMGNGANRIGMRGLVSSNLRGRARGRPPPPRHNPLSPQSYLDSTKMGTGTSATSFPSTSAGSTTSSAMSATQAAIAALQKLTGNGQLTAATLASALAALNQVTNPTGSASSSLGPKIGSSPAPTTSISSSLLTSTVGPSTTSLSSSIPSPASILAAFANVFKTGFPAAWKTASTPTSSSTPTSTTTTPITSTSTMGQSSGTPLDSLSSVPKLLSNPVSSSTQGVVARALAAAGAGRNGGITGLSNPVSLQTNALSGLSTLASLSHAPFPLMPFPISNSVPLTTSTPVSSSIPSSTAGTLGMLDSHQGTGGLSLLTPPSVPIIAIDDIDGGDAMMPIAGPEALAAAAAAAGVVLPVAVDYVSDEDDVLEEVLVDDVVHMEIDGDPLPPPSSSPPQSASVAITGGKNRPVPESITVDDDDDDEDVEDEHATADDSDHDDNDTQTDADTAETSSPTAPSTSGGKIRPRAAAVVVASRGGKTRGVAATTTGSTRHNTRSSSSTTTTTRSTTTPRRQTARKPAPSKTTRGTGRNTKRGKKATAKVVTTQNTDTEEASDFEIDVVDGDGVDDFR
ncbi:hypothetical protein DFS34DRAFT_684857 [Phlyctochytrium arcticum]|nr:hypothetical protein DFS34DRAFT_684857 [Phlyctochytrium arcticum]